MIKFKVKAGDLCKALDVVSVVTPVAGDKKGGYLFVVRAGGDCTLYSQEPNHQASSKVSLEEVEGEGPFIYPVEFAGGFKHLPKSDTLSIEAGERDNHFYVKYESSSGAEAEHPTFDPKGFKPVLITDTSQESDLKFPSTILRRAIDSVKSGMPNSDESSKVKDFYNSMQLFDTSQKDWEKGDGYLFGSEGKRGSYFYCAEFKGKGLSIHSTNIPAVTGFLGRCTGVVTLRKTPNWSFLINADGQTLGWTHQALTHPKFGYYPDEPIQLRINREDLARALSYMQEAVSSTAKASKSKVDQVRVVYTAEKGTIQVVLAEKSSVKSPNVTATPETELAKTTSFAAMVKIAQMADLLVGLESHEVLLKVIISPANEKRKRDYYHFRVAEKFWLDGSGKVLPGPGEGSFECQLTKFIPSVD